MVAIIYYICIDTLPSVCGICSCVVFVKNANENIPLSNIIEEFGILHNIIYLFIILVFIYY